MTDYPLVLDWLRAFLLTQAVELVVHSHAPGLAGPLRQRLAVGFGASAITHPMVWFVIPTVVMHFVEADSFRTEWWIAVAVAEAFALSVEAGWLRSFGVRTPHAIATSLLANGASFTIGLFCYRLLGW